MIKTINRSIQKFIKTESFAGSLLFAATIIALIWANSPYYQSYSDIWLYKLGFSFNNFELKKDLILWINDGLMAIFFFLIGLELKRELIVGEINSLKKASFPVIAALGGIILPIILFLFLNSSLKTRGAWGIPMATDIAFALAILTLLGNRIPLSLKIFLTAFAIIDDLAAVLVIAVFYSDNIHWNLFFIGLGLIASLALYYKFFKFNSIIGLFIGILAWYFFLKSGIHPTIAGVLLAFTIPLKRKLKKIEFNKNLQYITNTLSTISPIKEQPVLTKEENRCIEAINDLTDDIRPPLQKLEHQLHHFTAYFILPIFAFANAGVHFDTQATYDVNLILTIAISLYIGKLIGVSFFSFVGLKFKLARLPHNMNRIHLLGIAAIAGVGFTMSMFINNLAFKEYPEYINSGKIGIILGSLLAAITGYVILRFFSKNKINS